MLFTIRYVDKKLEILKHYRELYEALELVDIAISMEELKYFYDPNFTITYRNGEDKAPDVMIDFSTGCALFVKQKPIFGKKISISVSLLDENFEYPSEFNSFDELKQWLPILVLKNIEYEIEQSKTGVNPIR